MQKDKMQSLGRDNGCDPDGPTFIVCWENAKNMANGPNLLRRLWKTLASYMRRHSVFENLENVCKYIYIYFLW